VNIAEKSDGMFLWVRLQREQLRAGKNSKQLHRIINETPASLEHLYERNWAEISNFSPHDRDYAESILRWAAFALRPLTVRELADALVILNDDDVDDLQIDELPDVIDEEYINSEIIGRCSTLLEVRAASSDKVPASNTVHLVHFTVREYLSSKMPKLNAPFSSCGYENNHLAQLCLRYLQYKTTWDPSGPPGDEFCRRPFREYATNQWYQHLDAEASNYQEAVHIVNKFFDPSNEYWARWRTDLESVIQQRQSLATGQSEVEPANRLYYASLFGLSETVAFLQAQGLELDTIGGQYGTALQAACARGHITVFNFLVDCGASINTPSGEFGSAINAAAAMGNHDLVQHLINMGASLSMTDPGGRTSIYLASKFGHYKVVQMLLENGADLSIANNCEWTPLNSAADGGYLDVSRLLLEKGADSSIANDEGWTPINSAAHGGHLDVVRLLLEKGADLSITSNNGRTR
jgi:hypothetical protein